MRKDRSVVLQYVPLLLNLLLTIAVSAQTPPPKLTPAQWQADVRFLGDELPKRHRNAFHRMKREDFEAAVNKLYDAVPENGR
jgi:hypothetical protein